MNRLSTALEHRSTQAIDAAGDRIAARLRGSPAIDRAMYGLSQAANHSVLWHSINLVDALTGGPGSPKRALRRSLILVTEQALVNGPAKAVFGRRRPDALEAHPHSLRRPRTSSFPSGHASAAACAATLLSADHGHDALWWTVAVAVSYSRVHVGVHHASDVLAGAALGAGLARIGRLVPTPPASVRSR